MFQLDISRDTLLLEQAEAAQEFLHTTVTKDGMQELMEKITMLKPGVGYIAVENFLTDGARDKLQEYPGQHENDKVKALMELFRPLSMVCAPAHYIASEGQKWKVVDGKDSPIPAKAPFYTEHFDALDTHTFLLNPYVPKARDMHYKIYDQPDDQPNIVPMNEKQLVVINGFYERIPFKPLAWKTALHAVCVGDDGYDPRVRAMYYRSISETESNNEARSRGILY